MNKTLLVAAASVLVLAGAFPAAARPALAGSEVSPRIARGTEKILYNQNSNNSGVGLISQNFSSTYSAFYDCAGADDFVVPKGRAWEVEEVDVTGVYFNGSGPASSEDVTFYVNKHGKPAKGGIYIKLAGKDDDGSFAMALPEKLALGPGHYWVSVVANLDYSAGGEWGWEGNSTINGYPAMWENPGGGFGTSCSSWGSNETCLGYNLDNMFDLKGTSRNK